MHALAKTAEMAINRQNRQTVNKISNEMAKGPFGEWQFWRERRFGKNGRNGGNRQNRQTVNKNSNELAKWPFGKWRFWQKWQKWRLSAKIAKL